MPWHWHKNRLPSRVGIMDVYSVTTISEVSKLWYLSRTAILYAIDAGLITARKSGKVWLISVNSVVKRYGKPVKSIIESEIEGNDIKIRKE